VLQKVSQAEARLLEDPAERAVVEHFQREAEELERKLQDVPAALTREREQALRRISLLESRNAPVAELQAAEKALAAIPRTEAAATALWRRALAQARERAAPLAGMPPHARQFEGSLSGSVAERERFDTSRRNFLALVFCLMVGTAALPHILVRYYTTPSVSEARRSVTWTLFFVLLLYLAMPGLAVLVKHEVFSALVGLPFDRLPHWIAAWSRVDPGLISIVDVNRDGIVQLGEIRLGGDVVVLATPEIAGLPYVVSGLVAAGGLAAALSTADGLLLTIANALSHDGYFRIVDPKASASRRVLLSKILLLVVAVLAAMVAAQKPADIVFLVAAAFSLAAAGFFPALVLGIFWWRTSSVAAVAGMLAGIALTAYYMATTHPWLRELFGVRRPLEDSLWWGIEPISAGVFGVPVGFGVIVLLSLLLPERSSQARELVAAIRTPGRT
jgi:cation/acetate symporter